MSDIKQWSALRQSWVHIELPGIRELAKRATYGSFPVAELPEIPIELDDACHWLERYGVSQSNGLDRHEHDLDPTFVQELASEANIRLPDSFRRFMVSQDLQSRVRSATDCYLDPGERVVRTIGSLQGHLIHFLSDSQSCAHWYLHIMPDGGAAVLSSPHLYCYGMEDEEWLDDPSCGLDQIELLKLGFSCCALSFAEFLYRFWIENEIWFSLVPKESSGPLNDLARRYVEHYRSRRTGRPKGLR
jgi:hypothetical protein